uniref:Secreted protein n=1 Tax=Steinernema glaseri TaxID=37863 RepID=A0A1I7ZK59_9BILA
MGGIRADRWCRACHGRLIAVSVFLRRITAALYSAPALPEGPLSPLNRRRAILVVCPLWNRPSSQPGFLLHCIFCDPGRLELNMVRKSDRTSEDTILQLLFFLFFAAIVRL